MLGCLAPELQANRGLLVLKCQHVHVRVGSLHGASTRGFLHSVLDRANVYPMGIERQDQDHGEYRMVMMLASGLCTAVEKKKSGWEVKKSGWWEVKKKSGWWWGCGEKSRSRCRAILSDNR